MRDETWLTWVTHNRLWQEAPKSADQLDYDTEREDGTGFFRSFVWALLFEAVLAAVIILGWELYRAP